MVMDTVWRSMKQPKSRDYRFIVNGKEVVISAGSESAARAVLAALTPLASRQSEVEVVDRV